MSAFDGVRPGDPDACMVDAGGTCVALIGSWAQPKGGVLRPDSPSLLKTL